MQMNMATMCGMCFMCGTVGMYESRNASAR